MLQESKKEQQLLQETYLQKKDRLMRHLETAKGNGRPKYYLCELTCTLCDPKPKILSNFSLLH